MVDFHADNLDNFSGTTCSGISKKEGEGLARAREAAPEHTESSGWPPHTKPKAQFIWRFFLYSIQRKINDVVKSMWKRI
jgi:hypothetical protein